MNKKLLALTLAMAAFASAGAQVTVSATWPMVNSENQPDYTCIISPDGSFASSAFTAIDTQDGANTSILSTAQAVDDANKGAGYFTTFTLPKDADVTPVVNHTGQLDWTISVKEGFTFKPTKISGLWRRFGTNASEAQVLVVVDGTATSLLTKQKPYRGDRPDTNTTATEDFSIDLSSNTKIKEASNSVSVRINLSKTDNKQIGFKNIVIEGILTEKGAEPTEYSLTMTVEGAPWHLLCPYSTKYANQTGLERIESGKGVMTFTEGSDVVLEPESTPLYTFKGWSDGTTESKTVRMDGNKELSAVYEATDAKCIAGWDFSTSARLPVAPDFADENNGSAKLNIFKTDDHAVTYTGLDKSFGTDTHDYGFRSCSVMWQNTGIGTYNYETSAINVSGYKNITLDFQLYYKYNTYPAYKVQVSPDGDVWTDIETVSIDAAGKWQAYTLDVPAVASPSPQADNTVRNIYLRWIPDTSSAIAGTARTNDGLAIRNIFLTGEQVSTGITGIASDAEILSSAYYNLQGISVGAASKGLLIRVDTLSDGTVRKSKVIIR